MSVIKTGFSRNGTKKEANGEKTVDKSGILRNAKSRFGVDDKDGY